MLQQNLSSDQIAFVVDVVTNLKRTPEKVWEKIFFSISEIRIVIIFLYFIKMETNEQRKSKHHDERSSSNFGNEETSQRTKTSLRGSYRCLECDKPKKIMSVLIRIKILTAFIVLFSRPKLISKVKSFHVGFKSV